MGDTESQGKAREAVSHATDAFGLLADETRLEILLALGEHTGLAGFESREGMGFEELRQAVGVDDTGRFNYHLNKLREDFVQQGPDGYTLRYAGFRVTADVASGLYGRENSTATALTDVTCLAEGCTRDMEVTYDDGTITLVCPEDDHLPTFQTALPPNAAAGRTPLELLTIATRDARHMMEQVQAGTCPFCWSAMDVTAPADEFPDAGGWGFSASCQSCWLEFRSPVAVMAVHHPAVQMTYAEVGLRIDETPYLKYPFVRDPSAATRRGTDPTRLAIDTAVGTEADGPTIVLDQTLAVVGVE
jgi:hypothetical protein